MWKQCSIRLSALFFLVLFWSCSNDQPELLNKVEEGFVQKEGVLFQNGQLYTGDYQELYLNERIKFKTTYVDGLMDGEYKGWYRNGSKKFQRFYSKGKKSAVHQGWWENGNLKFQYPFNEKGQYNGLVEEWYESGQKYKEFNFLNGKEKGRQQMWKSDGRIKANYVVKNGETYGLIGLKRCNTIENDTLKK